MLADIEEEQNRKISKTRRHRSISKRNKLNRSPSPKITDLPRSKHRSPTKNRTRHSSKFTKGEKKYQHFVNDLNKDIQFYLNQRLRESRFDTRGDIGKRPYETTETKRLTADVQKILSGPALKSFYAQFIQSRQQQQQSNPRLHLHPLEESVLWSNEQE